MVPAFEMHYVVVKIDTGAVWILRFYYAYYYLLCLLLFDI